jgi:hypothetical protein
MNSRPATFYDNIYSQGMGMNFPHPMINYSSLLNDQLYLNGTGSGFDRFAIPPNNPNVPFNYIFGQGDHGIMGKNMPFVGNGGIAGIKGLGQVNVMGANKNFGVP